MIEDFLHSMGMGEGDDQDLKWDELIKLSQTYLILGDVGTGKTALATWLLERYSERYNLVPAYIGFPKAKAHLLPPHFITPVLQEVHEIENAIMMIDEAGLQLPIEDTKRRQQVVNLLSLPRQRKQILILTFHFPRLILGRYLPYFSGFFLKRPPYLIEFASKRQGDQFTEMMKKAEERFAELPPAETVKYTYVISPRLRWQGMIQSPLCSFWSSALSDAWSGVETMEIEDIAKQLGLGIQPTERAERSGWLPLPDGEYQKDENGQYFVVTSEMKQRKVEVERANFTKSSYVTYRDPVSGIHWIENFR